MTISAQVREALEVLPLVSKCRFRAPAQFDGASVPHFGFFTEDGKCLPSVAQEGYEMTTHDDACALTESAVEAIGCDNVQIKARWIHTKSIAKAVITVGPNRQERLRRYDIGGGDSIYPRFIIEAPFGKRFRCSGGFYRDLCRNLEMPRATQNSFSVAFTHTAKLRSRMDDLIATFRNAGDFEALVADMRHMATIRVDAVDFLRRLYPIAADATDNARTRAENRATAIYSRIARESQKTGNSWDSQTTSLWQMVQAVTGYVQHDKPRRKSPSDDLRIVSGLTDAETDAVWSQASQLVASA